MGRLVRAIVLLAGCAMFASAQTITGSVTDASGAAVNHIRIVATNTGTTVTHTASTP